MSAVLTFMRQDSAELVHDNTLQFPVDAGLPANDASLCLFQPPLHADVYGSGVVAVDTQQNGEFLNAERVERLLARAIRTLYPRGTIKRLARLLDVPIGTAHSLIHKRLSNWRRRDLAEKLLQEIYTELRSHIQLCIELEEITGNRNVEVGSAGDIDAAARALPHQKVDPLLAAARWLAEKASQ